MHERTRQEPSRPAQRSDDVRDDLRDHRGVCPGSGRICSTDIARGYKQLLAVEHGWRDMKQILDLRPVYHRLEQRIRAHVVLCWLALLLIRIIETRTEIGRASCRERA